EVTSPDPENDRWHEHDQPVQQQNLPSQIKSPRHPYDVSFDKPQHHLSTTPGRPDNKKANGATPVTGLLLPATIAYLIIASYDVCHSSFSSLQCARFSSASWNWF